MLTSLAAVLRLAGLCLLMVAVPLASQCGSAPRLEYDPAYDKTLLHLDPIPLDSVTQLRLLATFDGRRTSGSPNHGVVLATFRLTEFDPALAEDGVVPVAVLAASDSVVWAGLASPVTSPGRFAAVFIAAIPLDRWRQVAASQDLDLALAGRRLRLDTPVREAIRAYLTRIVDAPDPR